MAPSRIVCSAWARGFAVSFFFELESQSTKQTPPWCGSVEGKEKREEGEGGEGGRGGGEEREGVFCCEVDRKSRIGFLQKRFWKLIF